MSDLLIMGAGGQVMVVLRPHMPVVQPPALFFSMTPVQIPTTHRFLDGLLLDLCLFRSSLLLDLDSNLPLWQ